jgi:large subunit ribosomal protein L9
MEIILLERIENLGQMGQVVQVRPGYARNYLLPQKKALRATKANLAYFEKQRAQLETTNLKKRQEAESAAARMTDVRVVVIRQAGEGGQLYGSVSARDVAQAVTEAGYTVDRTQVEIDRPIKSLGLFEVRVRLHPEVAVSAQVNVARSPEEAQLQAQRGGMLTREEAEEEEEAAIEAPTETEEPAA